MSKIIEELSLLGDIQTEVKLSNLTTINAGGKCKAVYYPDSLDNLLSAIKLLRKENVKFKVFGKGSNLLCSDNYYDGIIIKMDRYLDKYARESYKMKVDAGCSIMSLSHKCADNGLSGLQFAGGIPGTIGGAIFMNAGAYKHEISEIVNRVLVIDENSEFRWISFDDCNFSYRHSIFQEKDWIIVQAEFVFDVLTPTHIKEIMNNRKKARVETQPLDKPSAGSSFKNPDSIPAWKLIREVGLCGYRVGGASVSEKHCNFIINDQNGTAEDIMKVIKKVEDTVYKKENIKLIREVELFNWDE